LDSTVDQVVSALVQADSSRRQEGGRVKKEGNLKKWGKGGREREGAREEELTKVCRSLSKLLEYISRDGSEQFMGESGRPNSSYN